jgi:hypothetical protein
MPDLIRHPEHIEFTGFRLPDQVRHKLHRNDRKTGKLIFYDPVNIQSSIFNYLGSCLSAIFLAGLSGLGLGAEN